MRYSLRELILVVLVIAAFLGWGLLFYSSQRPFQCSPFMGDVANFEWSPAIRSIREKLDEPKGSVAELYFFGEPGTASYLHEVCYMLALTHANEDAFLDALHGVMEAAVVKGRGELRGKYYGSGKRGLGDRSFTISYRHQGIAGTVRVHLSRKETNAVRLRIVLHEWRVPTVK